MSFSTARVRAQMVGQVTGFNDIDTQSLKCSCHLYFLNGVELATGHLLAIAERGVEDIQSVVITHNMFSLSLFSSYLCSYIAYAGYLWADCPRGCRLQQSVPLFMALLLKN